MQVNGTLIRKSGASAGGAAAPKVLLSRSVGQVGRKSETTLGIAGLHFKIGTFPGAAADQFELPAGTANAGNGQRCCGKHGDAPAGDGCRRQSEIGHLCRSPPAANGEADGAGPFGRELKAAGGRHGEPRDFGYDSAKAAMPQTFLETDEN
jgi:hypothetical protein